MSKTGRKDVRDQGKRLEPKEKKPKKVKVRGLSLSKEDYKPKPREVVKPPKKVERDQHLSAQAIWEGLPFGLFDLRGVTFEVHETNVGDGKTIAVSVKDAPHQSGLTDAEINGVYLTIGQLRHEVFISKLNSPKGREAQQKLWAFLRRVMEEERLFTEKRTKAVQFGGSRLITRNNGELVTGAFGPIPFTENFLDSGAGDWKTSDGVVIHCWVHDNIKFAKVSSAPEGHPLNRYKPFIKRDHLQVFENGFKGKELREYLREELRKIGALPQLVEAEQKVSA